MVNDPFSGAIVVGEEFSLPEIWLSLHQSAAEWARLGGLPEADWQRKQITASDHNLLRCLSDLPADRWAGLCAACGATTIGAIAGCWTLGADLPALATEWGQLQQETSQPFAMSARLAPIHLLPAFTQLTSAIQWANGNNALLGLIVFSQPEIELDLPAASISRAPPLVSKSLASRTYTQGLLPQSR